MRLGSSHTAASGSARHRRSATAVVAALIAAPLLSSCGFNYATDRVYTPGVGANNRDGDIDVLSAVIVTKEGGDGKEGVFVASFNNGTADAVKADGIAGANGETLTGTAAPVEIAPGTLVNLYTETETKPWAVKGDFAAGDFVPVTVSFSNGDAVTLDVPVVRNCGYYAQTPSLEGDKVCPVPEGEH